MPTLRSKKKAIKAIHHARSKLSQAEKESRKGVLIMIAHHISTRQNNEIKQYGIISNTYMQYKKRHPWLTERMVRHSMIKHNSRINTTNSSSAKPSETEAEQTITVESIGEKVSGETSIHFGYPPRI